LVLGGRSAARDLQSRANILEFLILLYVLRAFGTHIFLTLRRGGFQKSPADIFIEIGNLGFNLLQIL
jgi:hypothetical protein